MTDDENPPAEPIRQGDVERGETSGREASRPQRVATSLDPALSPEEEEELSREIARRLAGAALATGGDPADPWTWHRTAGRLGCRIHVYSHGSRFCHSHAGVTQARYWPDCQAPGRGLITLSAAAPPEEQVRALRRLLSDHLRYRWIPETAADVTEGFA